MTLPKPIAIIAHPRTGTHLLREMIAATKSHADAGEVFLPPDEMPPFPRPFNYWFLMGEAGLLTAWRGSTQKELANVATYYGMLRDKVGDRLPCIDVKPSYLASLDRSISRTVPLIVEGLAEQGFHFIHLQRRNLLEQVASLARAQMTGQWAMRRGTGVERDTVRMTLDPATILGRLNSLRLASETVTTMLRGFRPTELFYEELTENSMPSADLRQLLATECGVEVAEEYTPRNVKVSPPLDALVDNLEAIRRALEGTPYEDFLPRRDVAAGATGRATPRCGADKDRFLGALRGVGLRGDP